MKKATLMLALIGLVTVPAFGASLAVNGAAAIDGSFGMEVSMDGTTQIAYVRDNTPDSETVYRASFMLQRNNTAFVAPNNHVVFFAMQENGAPPDKGVVRLTFGQFADGRYFIRAFAGQNDPLNFRFIGGTIIPAGDTEIGVEFVQGDLGLDNGELRLYRNGVLAQERLDVKNDTLDIDHARFGAPSLVDASTTGSYYLDTFESFRTLSAP